MSASKTIAGLLCFCLLTGLTGIVNAQTPMPLQVEVGVNPPYPSRLDHLTRPNQVVISVYNNSQMEQRVWFRISIIGSGTAGGIRVVSDDLASQPVIPIAPTPPMVPRNIYYSELENYGTGFSSDMFIITVPPQLQAAVNNGYLPAGNYQICVEAIDEISGLVVSSPGPNNNCATFEVRSIPPPVIENPTDNARLVVSDPDDIIVRWSQNFATLPPDISYELDFRRIPAGSPLLQEMRNAGTESSLRQDRFNALQEETTATVTGAAFIYNTIQDNIDFDEGGVYALRIRAVSEEIYIQNGGFSNVVLFSYGASADDACERPDIQAQLVYPVAGDTLPFVYLPIMANFTPHCDNILRTESQLNVSNALPGTFQKVNVWPNGPSRFLRNYLEQRNFDLDVWMPDDRPEFAHTINLAALSSDPYCGLLERGKEHQAEGDITFTYRDEITNRNERQTKRLSQLAGNNRFYTGMPKPRLKKPARRDTLCIAQPVALEFSTGTAPQQILPLFRVLDIENRQNASTCAMLVVREKLVLQVARDEQFQNIVYRGFKKIQAASYNPDHAFNEDAYTFEAVPEPDWAAREYDDNALLDRIFKDFSFDFDASGLPSPAGEYFWRVGWVKEPTEATEAPGSNRINSVADLTGLTDNDFYWFSDVSRFVLQEIDCESGGTPATPVTATDTQLPDGCQAICEQEPPQHDERQSAATIANGSNIRIGQFTMTLTEAAQQTGTKYRGKGKIQVPWLNNQYFAVEFSALSIDINNRAFEGEIVAQKSTEILDQVTQLLSYFTDIIGSSNDPIKLPIGIDREVAGGFAPVMAITDMKFTPRRASFDARMRLDLPADMLASAGLASDNSNFPALGATDICFGPDGLQAVGRLHLTRDWQLTDNRPESVQFRFRGAENTRDTARMTYVEFDCNGFRCMNIAGEVSFPRSTFLPDSGSETDDQPKGGDVRVKGSFSAKVCDGWNILVGITLDPFQVSEAAGWGFYAQQAWLDISDLQNPPNMTFPEEFGNMGDARTRNTWKGFYLERLEVRTPKGLGYANRRTRFGGRNFIIDDQGRFNAVFGAFDVVRWAEESDASLSGLAFSLDEISMRITKTSNLVFEASLKGKLGLPILGEGDYFMYQARWNTNEGAFRFVVRPFDTTSVSIPFALARAHLYPNTHITVQIGNESFFRAELNGDLSISDGNNSSGSSLPAGFNLPGIRFTGLALDTRSGQSSGGQIETVFGQASPQKNVSGFPIQIDNVGIAFPNNGARIALNVEVKLTIVDGQTGFSAATGLAFSAAWNPEAPERIIRFEGFRVDLNSIELGVDNLSGMSFHGRLEFYNDGSNKGVKGGLMAGLPMGISAQLRAQFGTYRAAGAVESDFNQNANYYSYWFVDGKVTFGAAGITLFSGVQLYGIGGGVWYHMSRNTAAAVTGTGLYDAGGSNNQNNADNPPSGIQYTHNFDINLGLRLTVVIGSPKEGEVYNFDASLWCEFHGTGGFSVGLDGDVYVMTKISERNDPSKKIVWGTVRAEYDSQAQSFNAQIKVFVRVKAGNKDLLRGIGTGADEYKAVDASFHAGQGSGWYFKIGEPMPEEKRAGLSLDLLILQARLNTYLMVGVGIPMNLPPLPAAFQALLDNNDNSTNMPGAANIIRTAPTPTGEGFAMGAHLAIESRLPLPPFYLDINLYLGFDINVSRNEERVCAETGLAPGINRWYATGRMYAGLEGEFGVDVDLFFIKGKFPFLQGSIAMMMQGGLPNPNWAEGRATMRFRIAGFVDGAASFTLLVGEKCTNTGGNPFAGLDVIQDVKPEGTGVSVFTKPTATFAVPVNKVFEIVDAENRVSKYRPFVQRYELRRKSNGSPATLGSIYFSNENYVATFPPTEVLRGNTDYVFSITVKAYQIFDNGNRTLLNWEETRSTDFRTGPRPDVIVNENLSATYPIDRQNYFLKRETHENKGFLALIQADPYVFRNVEYRSSPKGSGASVFSGIPVARYRYEARYIPFNGGPVLRTPLVIEGNRVVRFDVSALRNQQLYALQIVRIKEGSATGEAPNISMEQLKNIIVGADSTDFSSDVTIEQGRKVTLPGEVVGDPEREKLLFVYYFETSRFNTLEEKLSQVSWNTQILGSNQVDMSTTISSENISEPFEQYDLQGWPYINLAGQTIVQSPLVRFFVNDRDTDNEFPTPGNLPMDRYMKERAWPRIYAQLNFIPGQQRWRFRHWLSSPPLSLDAHNYAERPISTARLRLEAGDNSLETILANWISNSVNSWQSGGLQSVSRFKMYNIAPYVALIDEGYNRSELTRWMSERSPTGETWAAYLARTNPHHYNLACDYLNRSSSAHNRFLFPCGDLIIGSVYRYPAVFSGGLDNYRYAEGSVARVLYSVRNCPVLSTINWPILTQQNYSSYLPTVSGLGNFQYQIN
jgi:hypothetical protein